MRSVGLIWFTLFPGKSFSILKNMSLGFGLPTKRRRASAGVGVVKDEVQEERGEQRAPLAALCAEPQPSHTQRHDGFLRDNCIAGLIFRAQNLRQVLLLYTDSRDSVSTCTRNAMTTFKTYLARSNPFSVQHVVAIGLPGRPRTKAYHYCHQYFHDPLRCRC